MIIRETPWEKDNLGVASSAVFQFEEGDDALPGGVVDNRDYEYQEAVVPMKKVDLLNALLRCGFSFAEVAMHISVRLDDIAVPAMFSRRMEGLSYHPASREELDLILDTMRQGNIFLTDKIALNSRFGPKVAGRRYALWTAGEVARGTAWAYIVECEGEKIGFFVLKQAGPKTADGMLSGMFDTSRSMGLGFTVVYYPMVEAKARGMTKLVTTVSSNNPSIYKINQALGFQIQKMDYILYRSL